ncbi:MAG: RNase adapter RapZ [Desulfonauticus sp.]|nr:RNase adapter RapZ [Desulfonauticus sp.]
MRYPFSLVLISGLSGAGKSTALKVFEDLGFFCIDGLPFSLIRSLIELFQQNALDKYRGLALGIDIRQIDLGSNWFELEQELKAKQIPFELIFLEASDVELVRRYSTTRRPHPLSHSGKSLEECIKEEKKKLSVLRDRAHLVIDTSFFSIHDLRRTIQEKWLDKQGKNRGFRVHLISFGFKYGVPLEADLVMDLRFLPNPFFIPELKKLTGQDKKIQEFVYSNEDSKQFLAKFQDFLSFLLPLYAKEGRYRVTLALGCTGGMHRSVATTELVAEFLREKNFLVSVEHRHLGLG